MLDLKLHLITILNNGIFLGLTRLAKARLGRDAVQASTQIISSCLQFPETSWDFHVFQPSRSTNTPHLCCCSANCMFHPSFPWLTVLFLLLLLVLPPSPTSLPANTFAGFLPALLTALLPFPPMGPLSLLLSLLSCPAWPSPCALPPYQG